MLRPASERAQALGGTCNRGQTGTKRAQKSASIKHSHVLKSIDKCGRQKRVCASIGEKLDHLVTSRNCYNASLASLSEARSAFFDV